MTTSARQPTEAEIQQIMADMEQRLRHRRRLIGDVNADASLRDDMRNVADNWHISAHLPITWSLPVVGRFVALAQRAIRLGLRWYINPIVDQQNDFNGAVARAFVRITAQQDTLAASVASLEQRLGAIEARLEADQRPVAPERERTDS